MTKEKILKILLVIFGVIMISAVGYGIWKMNQDKKISSKTPELVTPQKVQTQEIDTSDWKTYRNEEYGFEMKYPKEWKVTEVPEFGVLFEDEYSEEKWPGVDISSPNMASYRPPEEAEIVEWVKKEFGYLEERGYGRIPIAPNIEVDGTLGVKIQSCPPPTIEARCIDIIFIKKRNKLFEIQLNDSDKKELENLYNQILSLLKFL